MHFFSNGRLAIRRSGQGLEGHDAVAQQIHSAEFCVVHAAWPEKVTSSRPNEVSLRSIASSGRLREILRPDSASDSLCLRHQTDC